MNTLSSYLCGKWVGGDAPYRTLHNPTTGAEVAQASSKGIDLGNAVTWARQTGGPALRTLSFTARADLLDQAAKAINNHREALIDLALENGGNTRKDAKFDIDGATATLAYYARLGRELGDKIYLEDGEPIRLSRNPRYVGRHIRLPRHGVAVHINAFNFPAWGLAEKAAVSWLAGMPVLTKPATSTALVAHRIVEILADVMPAGTLSALIGSTGDLLEHLQHQDVIAFTGSSGTAQKIRSHTNVIAQNIRVNIEADSLNAAVLGPDVEPGSETWNLFLSEVTTDMTQKAGQKCTAIRRIFVPTDLMEPARDDLAADLAQAPVGEPGERAVRVGPLATADQQRDILDGIQRLAGVAQRVYEAAEMVGVEPGQGYFVPPTLFEVAENDAADAVHDAEVFGPVATLVPYDGSATAAVDLVRRGEGGLVASVYSNDVRFCRDMVFGIGPWHGRLHLASEKVAAHSPGPGTVLPQMIHGGPGRAGAGEELGGVHGMGLYLQRVAVQGASPILDKIFV